MLVVIIFSVWCLFVCAVFFFFQAEDGIRDLVRSRGLGDVYKRQQSGWAGLGDAEIPSNVFVARFVPHAWLFSRASCVVHHGGCLLYTSDAADERSSVDLGGRRIIKKKKNKMTHSSGSRKTTQTRTAH